MSLVLPILPTPNQQYLASASQIMPGGVNSPVRSFGSVKHEPIFAQSGQGALLTDLDGREYIDYMGSWGALPLGHRDPTVIKAMQSQLQQGVSYGLGCQAELDLAKVILDQWQLFDKIRFVNSGTEACMTAIRLARGVTGRDFVLKFRGCYHGHSDSFLVEAGSGALTLGKPTSLGVPDSLAKLTLIADYNDHEAVANLFQEYGDRLAAVILEPVAGNMNLIEPTQAFIDSLHQGCKKFGSLLIADEVMSGYRAGWPGVSARLNIKADLVVLGKVIGGGLNVAALLGRHEHMDHLAPLGGVYQAGTLSGNPLAMASGLATLQTFTKEKWQQASQYASTLVQEVNKLADLLQDHGWVFYHQGTMMGMVFSQDASKGQPQKQADIQQSDIDRFNRFHAAMLEQGILLPPSAYEAWFISSAHHAEHLAKTLTAIELSLKQTRSH